MKRLLLLLALVLSPIVLRAQCAVSVCPSTLNFGSQLVGTTSPAQIVALMNPLNSNLTISSFVISAGFSQTNTCGGSIVPASGCQISVTFSPASVGAFAGTLTVQDSAGSQTVALSGVGFVPSTGGSWTKLGPPGGIDYFRGWQRPIYDSLDKKLLAYRANPNCCYGTFSNAIHLYNSNNSFSQLWSHNTVAHVMEFNQLSRSGGVVSGVLATSSFTVIPGDHVEVTNVLPDASFDGTFTVATIAGVNITWNQSGSPDVAPFTPTESYIYGPGDRPSAPADRHIYGFGVWDSKRNLFWTGFGAAILGGPLANAADSGISDLYSFDPVTATWTELCGIGTTTCPFSPGTTTPITTEEASAAYDPINDVIVMYGGLVYGNPLVGCWLYHPATNTWVSGPQGPPALDYPIVVADGLGHVVLYGGLLYGGANSNQTWLLDLSAMTWRRLADGPAGSRAPVMDWVPRLGKFILIDTNQSGAHVWSLDTIANLWQDLGIASGPTLSSSYANNSGAYDQTADRFFLFIGPATFRDSEIVWSLQLP